MAGRWFGYDISHVTGCPGWPKWHDSNQDTGWIFLLTLFFPGFKNVQMQKIWHVRGWKNLNPLTVATNYLLTCVFLIWRSFCRCVFFLDTVEITFSILCNHNFNGHRILHHLELTLFLMLSIQVASNVSLLEIILQQSSWCVHLGWTSDYFFKICSQKSHYWVKRYNILWLLIYMNTKKENFTWTAHLWVC